jgi:hypothetical protein
MFLSYANVYTKAEGQRHVGNSGAGELGNQTDGGHLPDIELFKCLQQRSTNVRR